MNKNLQIRQIKKSEYELLGQLMIDVYSRLEGFPDQHEQPEYYQLLLDIGLFNEKENARVLVALCDDRLLGGVVYFSDMKVYGSGGSATAEQNASGIRFLAVDPKATGAGVGKALTRACIQLARENKHSQIILHTTAAMNVAWSLYQKLGFERSVDLDFFQKELPVFGFRLRLEAGNE